MTFKMVKLLLVVAYDVIKSRIMQTMITLLQILILPIRLLHTKFEAIWTNENVMQVSISSMHNHPPSTDLRLSSI